MEGNNTSHSPGQPDQQAINQEKTTNRGLRWRKTAEHLTGISERLKQENWCLFHMLLTVSKFIIKFKP